MSRQRHVVSLWHDLSSFSELTFTNDAAARVDGSGAIFSWLRAVSNSLLRLTPTTWLIADSVRVLVR